MFSVELEKERFEKFKFSVLITGRSYKKQKDWKNYQLIVLNSWIRFSSFLVLSSLHKSILGSLILISTMNHWIEVVVDWHWSVRLETNKYCDRCSFYDEKIVSFRSFDGNWQLEINVNRFNWLASINSSFLLSFFVLLKW